MSNVGYNGRSLLVRHQGVVIAAVQSKTSTHNRGAVDVTTDDSNGWRRLLPDPGTKAIDQSVEGVVTEDNVNFLLDNFTGSSFLDIDLVYPNGRVATAADGFFLGNIEMSAAQDGHVAFTAQLQSSGIVSITPAP